MRATRTQVGSTKKLAQVFIVPAYLFFIIESQNFQTTYALMRNVHFRGLLSLENYIGHPTPFKNVLHADPDFSRSAREENDLAL